MSIGNLKLDRLLNELVEFSMADEEPEIALSRIKTVFPDAGDGDIRKIYMLVSGAINMKRESDVDLVLTAPPSFDFKAKNTKTTVEGLLTGALKSITMTGYSLSEYFSDMIDTIIEKSQKGVFVKLYVNDIDAQSSFDKLLRYKGNFLKVYNYPKSSEDRMAALHAKVLVVDRSKTLITSANLSYHGQEGNIELGTLINSQDVAAKVEEILTQLLFKKIFIEA